MSLKEVQHYQFSLAVLLVAKQAYYAQICKKEIGWALGTSEQSRLDHLVSLGL